MGHLPQQGLDQRAFATAVRADLAGCTLSAWRLLERFDPAQPQVRVFNPDPSATDLEYAARINGLADVEAFIEAHSGAPWFVSMVVVEHRNFDDTGVQRALGDGPRFGGTASSRAIAGLSLSAGTSL